MRYLLLVLMCLSLLGCQKKIGNIVYSEKSKWNEICWVRALDKLNELRKNPNITYSACVFGERNESGHAWIEYIENGKLIQYDPNLNNGQIIYETNIEYESVVVPITSYVSAGEGLLIETNDDYSQVKVNINYYQYRYNKGGWAVFEKREGK